MKQIISALCLFCLTTLALAQSAVVKVYIANSATDGNVDGVSVTYRVCQLSQPGEPSCSASQTSEFALNKTPYSRLDLNVTLLSDDMDFIEIQDVKETGKNAAETNFSAENRTCNATYIGGAKHASTITLNNMGDQSFTCVTAS